MKIQYLYLLLAVALGFASCEKEESIVDLDGYMFLNGEPFENVRIQYSENYIETDSLGTFDLSCNNNQIYRLQAFYFEKRIVDTLVLVTSASDVIQLNYYRQLPVAALEVSPEVGDINTLFVFKAKNSYDPKRLGELSFRWDTAGGQGFGEWGSVDSLALRFPGGGTKQVVLQVRDKEGLTQIATHTLQLTPNNAPQVSLKSNLEEGNINTLFVFEGSATDPEDGAAGIQFRWNFDDGNGFTAWGDYEPISKKYDWGGNKTVVLQARDKDGFIGQASQFVYVEPNAAPVVELYVDQTQGDVNTLFGLTAKVSDPEDGKNGLLFRWNFDDGNGFDEWGIYSPQTIQYLEGGQKTIELEVKDKEGKTQLVQVAVEVKPNEAPIASLDIWQDEYNRYRLDASKSTDPEDGFTGLQFRWDNGTGSGFTDWTSKASTYLAYRTAGVRTIRMEVKDKNGKTVRINKQLDTKAAILPFDMITVQGGSFLMGSDRVPNEMPIHQVQVHAFFMGKFEVTQAFWKEIMDEVPANIEQCDQCPVAGISWNEVQEFLKKLNYMYAGFEFRLPSEAEWEFAARGGNATRGLLYAGSAQLDPVAWYVQNSLALGPSHPNYGLNPVGTKLPNELGLYDMSGNVWEWCADDYFGNYDGSPSDGSPRINSQNETRKVLRGGAWGYDADNCTITRRHEENSDVNYTLNGFRIVHAVNN